MQLVSSLIPGNTIDVVVKEHAVQGGLHLSELGAPRTKKWSRIWMMCDTPEVRMTPGICKPKGSC